MALGFHLQLLFVIVNVNLMNAFFPNHYSDVDLGEGTWTHEDITAEGILRAVAAFFEENPRPGSNITKGELTGMDDISAQKLFVKYYGAEASEQRFRDVIDEIVFANMDVDFEHETSASWHFNGETITKANELLIERREKLIDIIKKDNPLLDHAVELIAQCLHILQMFYSNTNWVEIKGAVPYYSLGIRGKPLYGTAPPPMDTCRSCGKNTQSSCRYNLIVGGQILTSGYKSGQRERKPFKDPKTSQTGKCSHGGAFDETSKNSAALGGINKDSNSSALSPHHHLHAAAAKAAIAHTVYFFEGKEHGLRRVIGNTKYQKLLQLKAGNSMALVVDYSGSMSDDIDAVKTQIGEIVRTFTGTINEPSSYIVSLFNDPLSRNKVVQFDSGDEALAYIMEVEAESILNYDCPEYVMDGIEKALILCQPDSVMYVFTDASAKDPEKAEFINTLATKKRVEINFLLTGDCGSRRRSTHPGHGHPFPYVLRTKRSVNGYELFKSLSESTGGAVYVTSKAEISHVADLIKESALGSTVTILKKTISSSSRTNIIFPVDVTVRQITVKIITTRGSPSQQVISPNGSSDIQGMTVSDVGASIKLIKIKSPVSGNWHIRKTDRYTWDLKITAQSTLDISTTFVQKHPKTGFEYEITGRPIAGENATLIAKLPSLEMARSLGNVVLLDSTGSELVRHVGFKRVKGRAGSAVFRRQFELPGQSFHIALTGTDTGGNEFLRLVAENIVPVNIKLKILPVSDSLYVSERLSIPVEVTNKGDATTSITVSLKDDKNFAQAPVKITFRTEASETKSAVFRLRAGTKEGVTTTVTVSAKSSSADSDNFQYAVRRFTTTKRVVRESDRKDPVCRKVNVTSTCDVTILDPCLCSHHQWSATAEVGDDGFGLFQVSSSIESHGNFTVDNFTMGHKIGNGTIHANIWASCCDAVAYINVVDVAGNIGQCFFNVITDDGETVNNASVIDRVKSRYKCQTTTTTTTTMPSRTIPKQNEDDEQVEVTPKTQKQLSPGPGVVVGIPLAVAAIILVIACVIVVIVKKTRVQKSEMTVEFEDK